MIPGTQVADSPSRGERPDPNHQPPVGQQADDHYREVRRNHMWHSERRDWVKQSFHPDPSGPIPFEAVFFAYKINHKTKAGRHTRNDHDLTIENFTTAVQDAFPDHDTTQLLKMRFRALKALKKNGKMGKTEKRAFFQTIGQHSKAQEVRRTMTEKEAHGGGPPTQQKQPQVQVQQSSKKERKALKKQRKLANRKRRQREEQIEQGKRARIRAEEKRRACKAEEKRRVCTAVEERRARKAEEEHNSEYQPSSSEEEASSDDS
ncbi:hypothetical protein PRZ48_001895 [Zasmidium cellare]|uniref:Uncharacterized protein n=1 Tax=Zasmidium cellare TaxID=395010 RepID=A0ABR0F2R2_ZASCE|nr:hypothetical protein PRZ48_001895 [Zasmidium cellare]